MRCSMTGRPMESGDGIYEDGEWISWDWINSQLHHQELISESPQAQIVEVIQVFEDLVRSAYEYHLLTGRYLQIWGELGELYAEIKHGVQRHRPGTQGSDGRIGNDWVEIKTISPEKGSNNVEVKRAGNFNKLIIVKISEDFEFESKVISRKSLGKGSGKKARYSWD